jgi:hypothetical protein
MTMKVPDLEACCSSCAASDSSLAIYCTLDTADLEPRLRSIRAVAARALIHARQDGGHLRLLYRRDAATEIEALLNAERTCCAFVESESHMTDEGLAVSLSAKAEDRAAARPLLDGFAGVAHET